MHLIRYLRRLIIRGKTQTSTPLDSFIPEIWATETRETLEAVDRMMSSLPQPPHRRVFVWWHDHFCGACKVYQQEVVDALKKFYVGREVRIPQFVSLTREDPDV